MINGKTILIAHLGYPTESFKAPMIYNPYFEKHGIDAVVVPMGVQGGGLPGVPAALCSGSPTSAARSSRCRTRSRPSGLVDEVIHGGADRGRLQRHPAASGRHAARRHVRRRGLRARRACARAARSRARARSSSAAAASARPSRPRSPARASPRLGLFDVNAASARGARRTAARRTIPTLEVDAARKIPPATTSSSTRRRSA